MNVNPLDNALSAQMLQEQTDLRRMEAEFKNPPNHEREKLKKVAKDFESIFFKQLLDAMDKTVDRSNTILSGGNAEDMFRGMLNDNIAQMIATRPGGSGLGLAEVIYRQAAQNLPPIDSVEKGGGS